MSSIWKQFTQYKMAHDVENTFSRGMWQQQKHRFRRDGYTLLRIDHLTDECFQLKPLEQLSLPVIPPWNLLWIERAKSSESDAYLVGVSEDRSYLLVVLFAKRPNNLANCIGSFRCPIDFHGAARIDQIEFSFEVDGRIHPGNCRGCSHPQCQISLSAISTTLNILALLHCRNVKTQSPKFGGKLKGQKKPKGYSEWKTLEISVPGVKTNSHSTDSGFVGLTRQHLVRGHFADYRNGAGMFGRESMRGIYWISPHVKGNPEHGTIVKDYSLKPAADGGLDE